MATKQDEYSLYGGKVILKFDPRKHRYTVKNKLVPSVTGITGLEDKSGPLIGWALNQAADLLMQRLQPGVSLDEVEISTLIRDMKSAHRRSRQQAADIGTLAHEWAEKHILYQLGEGPKAGKPVNPQVMRAAKAVRAFEKQHKVEYVFAERKVMSIEHWFAGTVDAGARIDGELGLIDFKSSKASKYFPYNSMRLQTAGYVCALQEEYKDKFTKRFILRLDKDTGDVEPFDINDDFSYEEDMVGFLGLRQAHRRLKGS